MTARNQFQGITHEGMLRAEGRRFAIVAARFNDFIVDKLLEGALDAIRRTGGDDEHVEIFRCPGAMELPGLARRVIDLGRFDAVICLGAVIRGATPHFDLVVGEAARGIAELAAAGGAAVAFGVLACDTIEQAVERAGTKAGNRGYDAAMVALEMADLYAALEREPSEGSRTLPRGTPLGKPSSVHAIDSSKQAPRDIGRRPARPGRIGK